MDFKKLLIPAACLAALSAPLAASADQGYTIDMDFQLTDGQTASVMFGGKDGGRHFYMWQINPDKLNPHDHTNNDFWVLPIPSYGISNKMDDGEFHHIKIQVHDNYTKATTWIDDELIEENHNGDFDGKMFGFRQYRDKSAYDNIVITDLESGNILYSEDFNTDNGSPAANKYFTEGWWENGVWYCDHNGDGERRAWSSFGTPAGENVHFSLEFDMNLQKDNLGVVFSGKDDANMYLWAINFFDEPKGRIRHHNMRNGGWAWWNDQDIRDYFWPEHVFNTDIPVKIEVKNSWIETWLDGTIVDRYFSYDADLVPAKVGFRLDNSAEQDEDCYVDNVVYKTFDAEGNATVVLTDDFEPESPRWFTTAIVEEFEGSNRLHIYGDGAKWLWLNADEPRMPEEEVVDNGYTIDFDFEIDQVSAGFCFGVRNTGNYYMWQINAERETTRLRPHCWSNGNPALLGEIDLPEELGVRPGTVHHMQIVVENNQKCDTYIDGTLVDTRMGDFPAGTLGLRHSFADDYVEAAYFDNLVMTSNADKSVLFSADFEKENPFCSGELVEGRLYDAGVLEGTVYAWDKTAFNDVWYTVELDMELVNDDLGIVFSEVSDADYYVWAINCFDKKGENIPILRRHIWNNNNVWFDNPVFNRYYSVDDMLNNEHHVAIEVHGPQIKTFIDDVLVNAFVIESDKLAMGKVGFRLDSMAEQDDQAYVDNVTVTEFSADGAPTIVLSDTFEPGTPSWFETAGLENAEIAEGEDGNHRLRLGQNGTFLKLMQRDIPTSAAVIELDETEGAVEYFNMQGMRINRPAEGLYIERRGGKAVKKLAR